MLKCYNRGVPQIQIERHGSGMVHHVRGDAVLAINIMGISSVRVFRRLMTTAT